MNMPLAKSEEMFMFHASSHLYHRPDYDLLSANRTNHANGALGLWVSHSAD
jgi:hypothetical protein